MELLTTNQYNQGIGKNKLLSSTAGVGAIITTRMGYYILVSDINKWDFVQEAQKIIEGIRIEETDTSNRYKKASQRIPNAGIGFIDDLRFIDFLKNEKELPELLCFTSIPSISLNEQFNSPNWKNHPIRKLLGDDTKAENFMVKGTHFPKWFIGDKNQLKPYEEWKRLWIKENLGVDRFVPPRDATSPIKDLKGETKSITISSESQGKITYKLYKPLTQTNLILVCPNGHLSDIPWPKFLRWKTEMQVGIRKNREENAESLFDDLQYEPCCSHPILEWTESKTKSEGYGSIFIECKNCGLGSGDSEKPKINLEGINNLTPNCDGQKPWEINLSQDSNFIPHEDCFRKGDRMYGREQMQVSLVTSNNVYYSNGFSSLFIPQHLAENKSPELVEAKTKLNEKFQKYLKAKPEVLKGTFWTKLDKEDFIIENGFKNSDIDSFLKALEIEFLELQPKEDDKDMYEVYRWQEYQCFCNLSEHSQEGLLFNDIELPGQLQQHFKKIQQIDELKVTQVQLDFTRIKPKERLRIGDDVIESTPGKNVFSIPSNEVFVLPANESYGEGLFFQFQESEISKWIAEFSPKLKNKYGRFFEQPEMSTQGAVVKNKIFNNGYKQFLIHTFSHLLMRELEFSCGYPTASLKERLYISDRMAGVLIYTAEGSEGSMGGLVWQGQPTQIQSLIFKSLQRTSECSSDPLCWESDGQGIFDLNMAACFSCSLVSETACEEMNLGLDRRILIDQEYGFFKDLV